MGHHLNALTVRTFVLFFLHFACQRLHGVSDRDTSDCDFGMLKIRNGRGNSNMYAWYGTQYWSVVNLLETKLHKHQGETLQ